MPVFIELTTDAFTARLQQEKASKQKESRTSRAGRRIARRPVRGLEIKDDTYAILKLIRSDGKIIPLIDSGQPDGLAEESGYANFLLQDVKEVRMEKHQIVETFGESYVFFFGEAPRFIDVNSIVLNSHDFNWEAEWWENYDKYLRGTKSVELGARVYLFYDDTIVEGYVVQSGASKSAQTPLHISLQFRMFVTNADNISSIGDANFPIRSSVMLPDGVELTSSDGHMALVSHYRDEALARAEMENFDTKGQLAADNINTFGGTKKLSEMLRAAPRSFGVSADVWTRLEGEFTSIDELADLHALIFRDKPLRGLIASNIDEYVGAEDGRTNFGYEPGEIAPPSAIAPRVRSLQESNDIFRDSIEFLSCYGANINNPDSLISIGLGPKFGKSTKDGATFTPIPGVPFGFGVTDSEGVPSKDDWKQFKKSPLKSIFGEPRFESDARSPFGNPKNSDRSDFSSRYYDNASDPAYGYQSEFGGTGYGVVGFGDFGGVGYGSCNSRGDPGYVSPDRFTFAGVSDNRDAFNRFLKPREDTTSLTLGGGIGVGASTGGPSTRIQGEPSPFAFAVVEGSLDTSGTARSTPQAISDRRGAQLRRIYTDNPYGVSCAGGGSVGFEAGASITPSGTSSYSHSLP